MAEKRPENRRSTLNEPLLLFWQNDIVERRQKVSDTSSKLAIIRRAENSRTAALTWTRRHCKASTLNWQNRRPKQWSKKLNWTSKLKYGDRSSDPSKVVIHKVQPSRREQTWRPKQAHGVASPLGHPTDHRDRWTHWLEIKHLCKWCC